MFVETYRQENGGSIMAGGDARRIPYPKISQEDWRAWTLFLPVRSASIDRVHAIDAKDASLHVTYGIPYTLTEEVRKAAQLFDNVEVWRKHKVNKDPAYSNVELCNRTGRRNCRLADDECLDMVHVS